MAVQIKSRQSCAFILRVHFYTFQQILVRIWVSITLSITLFANNVRDSSKHDEFCAVTSAN